MMKRLLAAVFSFALAVVPAFAQQSHAVGPNPTAVGQAATPLSTALGGTNDTGTAWSTFTPTMTCGTGTVTSYTTQTGRYKLLGKSVVGMAITIVVNNAGTCSGAINIASLPVTISGSASIVVTGRNTSNGQMLQAIWTSGTTMGVVNSDNSNPAPTNALVLSIGAETN